MEIQTCVQPKLSSHQNTDTNGRQIRGGGEGIVAVLRGRKEVETILLHFEKGNFHQIFPPTHPLGYCCCCCGPNYSPLREKGMGTRKEEREG